MTRYFPCGEGLVGLHLYGGDAGIVGLLLTGDPFTLQQLHHPLVAVQGQMGGGEVVGVVAGGTEMEIRGRKMVHMGMGDEQILHGGEVQPVLLHMGEGICGEINEQVVVHQSLGTAAEVLAPSFQSLHAVLTAAEQCGPALCGGGAQVCQFHKIHFLCCGFSSSYSIGRKKASKISKKSKKGIDF